MCHFFRNDLEIASKVNRVVIARNIHDDQIRKNSIPTKCRTAIEKFGSRLCFKEENTTGIGSGPVLL